MGAPLAIPYSVDRWPFAALAAAVLGVDRLEELAAVERARCGRRRLTYEDNLRLRAKLSDLPAEHPLKRLYQDFVCRVVAPVFGGRVGMTEHATWRVQMAGTPSVSAWHRDADVTGRPDYLTVWVPFVDTFGGNTLWVEPDYGAGDHAPVPVRYGEALCFDGAMLEHGTVANDTVISRVSMDFRIVPRPIVENGPGDRGVFAGRPTGSVDDVIRPAPVAGAVG